MSMGKRQQWTARGIFLSGSLWALLMTAVTLTGQQTHTVVDSGYESFAAGELEGMALRAEGQLETGPRLDKLAELEAATVWATEPDGAGGIWISAGDEARLWHVDGAGTVTERFAAGAVFGAGLARDAAGRLYFGTSPNGRIYKLDTEGESGETLVRLPVQYIWGLAMEGDFLWAATGQPARLYKVDPASGEAEMVFEAPVEHFQSYVVADGHHYVGAGPGGTVYRVSGEGEAEALVTIPEPEVRGLAVDGNGELWILGHDPKASGGGGNADAEAAFLRAMQTGGDSGGNGKQAAGSGRLYRRTADGFVLPVWEGPGGSGGGASLGLFGETVKLVGMTSGGRVYGITGRDRWGELVRLPAGGEVSALRLNPAGDGGVFVVSSQPGAVYRLGGHAEEPGVFTSRILDASQPVRWGTVELLVEGQPELEVEVRGGNSPEVDATWTDWRAVETAREGSFERGTVALPPSRYGRYRLSMTEVGARDALRRVRFFVQLPNAAPVLGKIVQLPYAVESRTVPGNGRGFAPEQLFREGSLEQLVEGQADPVQFQRSAERSGRSFFWQAKDPNGDPLLFDLYLHSRDTGEEHLLEADLEEWHYVLVTDGLAEGVYQMEVVARDAVARSGGGSREFSEPFVVDQRPPEIEVVERSRADGGLRLVFRVRDALSVVRTVEVGLAGEVLRPLLPEDGLYDRREERFEVEWPEVEAGTDVRIRAVDESGREALRVL